MFCRDYDSLTAMPTASAVALSCTKENSVNAAIWMLEEPFGLQRPSCFQVLRQPSAPLVGVSPAWKLGPEDNSHSFFNSAVTPGRNVA
jgi:hypothetical protein